MSERILVTGATGKVGREVVRALVAADREVKAATRTPDEARRLFSGAVDAVEFDYDHADTWDAAVEWADRIFAVPPPFDPQAYRHLAPFVDWAVQAGCRHVVALTGMGVEAREDLALHRFERHVRETGVTWTFLRPNVFMQNFNPGFLGRQIRADGTFRLPVGGARVSLVDARDVAGVAARVLTGDEHGGRAYTLTGPESLDHHRIAAVLAEAWGRPVRYEPIDESEMAAWLDEHGWPDDQAEVVIGLARFVREGARAEVTDDVERVLGRPATPLERWAQEQALE